MGVATNSAVMPTNRAVTPSRTPMHAPRCASTGAAAAAEGMLAEGPQAAHPRLTHCIRHGGALWVAHGERIANPRVHVAMLNTLCFTRVESRKNVGSASFVRFCVR
jgi:hypothetical protein